MDSRGGGGGLSKNSEGLELEMNPDTTGSLYSLKLVSFVKYVRCNYVDAVDEYLKW